MKPIFSGGFEELVFQPVFEGNINGNCSETTQGDLNANCKCSNCETNCGINCDCGSGTILPGNFTCL